MRLVDQWRAIEARLPDGWESVRLTLATEDPRELAKAAATLGPVNPGRAGEALVFEVRRHGGPAGPEGIRRLLGRLDEQRIWSTLERGDVREAAPAEAPAAAASVVASWEAALAELPGDWSELLCRLEIAGSDLLPRAALLCGPVNPTRDRDAIGFLFRCGRVGYGVSPEMARRCFARLDEEGIRSAVTVLRVLSDTHPVASQGSSWIVDGRVL
jgi:hypothetical protein